MSHRKAVLVAAVGAVSAMFVFPIIALAADFSTTSSDLR